MAELAAEAFLSSFINVLFQRMATKEVLNFFQGKKVIAELLYELKTRLRSANKLLTDAEEKQFTDEDVKNWLDEMKEVVFEADYVFDKINTEAIRCELEKDEYGRKASKFFNFIPKLFNAFEYTVNSEIQEILGRLNLLLDQNEFLGLKEFNPKRSLSSKRLPAPLVEEHDVFGRESDKEAIIKLLLSNDVGSHKIFVISIVGMGGIGKTTLAQLIYKHKWIQEHFELKAWVTVSEDFDVPKIIKMILKAIDPTICEIEDPYQLQVKLKNVLMRKKFLIVLDDVWNEDYKSWDILKSPFECGAHGSKILVTTRSEIVAAKMRSGVTYNLQSISNDDCLQLFTKHVFNHVGFGGHSNLQQFGIEIVRKCKGLPLAVKSIAGLLHPKSTLEEWNVILQSDVWELQFRENQNNNIPPALWLSYCFLPSELKRCFAYCSIFPKDYEFSEDDQKKIILLWMAEGILQPKRGKTMEDIGEEYLNALISRSFFQRSIENKSILLMHDLVHDLATRISGEFCCVLDDHNNSSNLNNKTRLLSCKKNSKEYMIKLEDLSNAKCLRTLLALPLSYGYFSKPIPTQSLVHGFLLRAGGRLRALSLSECPTKELPESIGDLKQIRYLDLSGLKVTELPNSICTLYNLQTLLLSYCENLRQLPSNMSNLINLRHLDIRNTRLKEMPPNMCNLTNLQTLSDFVLGESDGSRINELDKLQLLHGSLQIKGLQNVVNFRDVLKANLKKKGLSELILRWAIGDTNDSTKEREVLDALKPDKNYLKELKIIGYKGTIFPSWVAHHSYCNMMKVKLEACTNCCFLSPFGQLPSLKVLEIDGLNGVVSIGDEFSGTSMTESFPSLEILSISNMDFLEKWSLTGANQDGTFFPCVKKLDLIRCSKLKVGLPAGYFPSLKSIRIQECNSMVAVFPTSDHQQIDTTYPSLQSLILNDCSRLESFSGMDVPSSLKSLSIFDCEMLWTNLMNWDLQRFTSLQSLYINGYEEVVDSFPKEGQLLPTSLTSLSIGCFRKLKALNGKAFQHLTSLQQLKLWNCKSLSCLPEEGLPPNLTSLWISNCTLLNQRCQRDTGEDWPKIQHIPRIYICLEILFHKQKGYLPEEKMPLSLSYLDIFEYPMLKNKCRGDAGEDWPKIASIPQILFGLKEI